MKIIKKQTVHIAGKSSEESQFITFIQLEHFCSAKRSHWTVHHKKINIIGIFFFAKS